MSENIPCPLLNPICWACRRRCKKGEISIRGPNFWGTHEKLIGIFGRALDLPEEVIKEAMDVYSQLIRSFSPRGQIRTLVAIATLYTILKVKHEYSTLSSEKFLKSLPRAPCKPFGWATAKEIQHFHAKISKLLSGGNC